jgi:SNF family Na+-dependent transporter
VDVWIAAIGQLFYGVSAGGGILTTYASFTPKGTSMVTSAVVVALGNSSFSCALSL